MRWSIIALLFIIFSCSRTEIPFGPNEECPDEITYLEQTKEIIDATCAYSGCHISGFPSGSFDTYEGLESFLNSGQFSKRVIELQDMPPVYATEGPTELTEEQLMTIICWSQNDFKE